MEKRKQEQKQLELQEIKTVITNKMKDLYREKVITVIQESREKEE